MKSTLRPGVHLQDRDLGLLRGLFESRVMTLQHAAVLYFDGRHESAKKRLQKLKGARLVAERPRRRYEAAVLFLTRKAFRVLEENGVLTEYPRLGWKSLEKRARVSDLTLRHELAVMAVKAATLPAVNALPGFAVVEFSTWPRLYEFHARQRVPGRGHGGTTNRVLVKPDGHIRVHEKGRNSELFEHTFFLEVDRSTESQQILALRATAYIDYYQSGGLAVSHGYPRSAYKRFPFRVLMVLKNAERRNNPAERLLQQYPPILTQVWLTTFAEVTTAPLRPIWVRPKDYREVTQGTAYDPERRRELNGYRRQPERERLIEQAVQKVRLLE